MGWRRKLRPIPLEPNRLVMMVLRADEFQMLFAAASVIDPPNPTMDW
jgi:hypothetical protein